MTVRGRFLVASATLAMAAECLGSSCGRDVRAVGCQPDDSKANATSTLYSEERVFAKDTLFQQELQLLSDLVAQCEEKVQLLNNLRAIVKAMSQLGPPMYPTGQEDSPEDDQAVGSPWLQMLALQEDIETMLPFAAESDLPHSAAAADFVLPAAVVPLDEKAFLVKLVAITYGPNTPASHNLMQPPSALLLAVQANGLILAFFPSGDMATTFPSGHDTPVAMIAGLQGHSEATITTADSLGGLRVHRLRLRPMNPAHKRYSQGWDDGSEPVTRYLGTVYNITVSSNGMRAVLPEGCFTTALAVTMHQGVQFVLLGDSHGRITILTAKGSLHKQLQVEARGQIQSMDIVGGQVLFLAAGTIGFVSFEKEKVYRMHCAKFPAGKTITSAVLDQRSHRKISTVLATDEDYRVWVFTFSEAKGCKVQHAFPPGAPRVPVDLRTAPGFALALEQPSNSLTWTLSALNLTHVGKRRSDPDRATSSTAWQMARSPIRSWSVLRRNGESTLLAFLSADGLSIELAHLLTPSPQATAYEGTLDFVKLPLFVASSLAFMGFKMFRRHETE